MSRATAQHNLVGNPLALIEHQRDSVSLELFRERSSRPTRRQHRPRELFSLQDQPFFSQADLVEIGPLSDADLYRIIEDGFESTDRMIGSIASADSGWERFYSSLPTGHQKTLRALASGGSVYGTAASLLDLPAGTARDALEALDGNGILRHGNGESKIIDPLLSDWLRRRFGSPV